VEEATKMSSTDDLAAAEQQEQALEQEVAALEEEVARLEAAYLERQRVFEERRDALMTARRMVQMLKYGQVAAEPGSTAGPVDVPAGVGEPSEDTNRPQ
jgi:hypothetical protein